MMRYVCSMAAVAVALVLLTPFIAPGQDTTGLTISKYTLIGEERLNRTQWYVTYRAEVTNKGAARSALTAVVTSLCAPVQVVPGQGTVHFGPVPANGSAMSIDTFTLLVDRSVPFDIANLSWSFVNPVANAGPNQTAAVGAKVTLNGSASTNPSGAGVLTYRWTLQSKPSLSQAAISNAASVIASFVVDAPGTYVAILTVDNGLGTDKASVAISTVNSPPVSNAGPNQTVPLNSTVTLNGSASSDVDGNPLTFQWNMVAHPLDSACQLSGGRSVNSSFTVDKAGIYIAQLIVNDGIVDSAPSTVTITTMNTPPVADAGKSQTVTVGALVQLNAAGSTDVDGDSLTYLWSLISSPSGTSAKLSNVTAVNPTFTADQAGVYVAQLVVNDGKVNSAPATVAITTNAIQKPVANAGANQTVAHGTVVTLSGSCSDPQSLPCSYAWSLTTRPSGSSAVLSAAAVPNPNFFADVPGTYVAQLVVSNGVLPSQPATVTITTTNTPPVANAGQNRNVYTGAVVALDGGDSTDSDHDPISYSWSFATRPAESTTVMQAPNSRNPSFFADVPGTYIAQLIVNDGFTASNPSTVTITASTMAISLSPNPLKLYTSSSLVTVTLSGPAGPGGVTVTFSGFDGAIISVPANVHVPENATGANVTVTPLAAGSTKLIASAPNYQAANVSVTVATPRVTISSDVATVGVSRSIDASLTLNAPAPPGGAAITLSANPALVSFDPATVSVPGGQTTSAVKIFGVAEGAVTVTAALPGYIAGTLNLQVVKLGAILLPANLTVRPGQPTNLDVSLSGPAPAGGVTVTLASGNTSVLTVPPSAFIAAGATSPATPPQVTGVAFGSATIAASAPGCTGSSQTVKVGAALSFSNQAVTVGAGGVQNANLLLSAPAPAGGLTVSLTSADTAVATVPASVTIDAGATSVAVPVTGVTGGPATITASTTAPNVTSATLNVTVVVSGSITVPSSPSLKPGQSVAFPIALSSPAPQGGVTVNLSSANASIVTVSPATVTIPANQTQPNPQPQITGVSLGTAAVSASAVSYTPGTANVAVGASLSLAPATVTLTGPQTTTLTLTLPVAAPYDIVVNLTASPNGKVTLPASVAITKNATSVTFDVTGAAAGTTTITAAAATAPNISSATATVTTEASGAISLPSNVSIGLGQSAAFQVALPAPAPAGGVSVSLSSSNAAKVSISPGTVTIPAGQTQPATAPQVTGVDIGSADITAAANLYTSGVKPVQVTASISLSPQSLTLAASETKDLTLTLSGPAPAGGMTFTVSSSNNNAATCKSGTAKILANSTTATISVSGVSTGSATVRVSAPNMAEATADVTVTPSIDIIMPASLTVTPGDVKALSIRLAHEYASTVFLNLASSDATKATVWPTSVTIAPGQTVPSTPVSVTGVASGSATITAQGNGISINPASTAVTVGYRLTLSPSTVTILGAGNNGTLNLQLSGPAPAAGLLFTITSSNTGVVTAPPDVFLPPTASSIGVRLTSVAAGSAVIRVSAPDVPEATANVTVVPPGALTMSAPAAIGLNEEANLTIGLSTPAPAGGVTVEFATSDNKKVGLSQASVNIPAGATAPTVPPKIIGVNTGSATITATAAGYSAPAPLTVNVSASVNWVTPNVTIVGAGKQTMVTLRLSTTAPMDGLTVNLTSTNPNVATIQPTAIFIWDGSNAPGSIIPVTSVGPGVTTLKASGTNVPEVTMTVTVVGPLTITSPSLPDGYPGTAYNATVVASGGISPYTWSASGLPSGLAIDSVTGVISGAPSSAGSSNVTVTVTDSQSPAGTASKQFTLTIAPGLSITTASLPAGTIGSAYTANLAASGGATPYAWSATGLPSPLTINPSTGAITGTPTAASSVAVTVTVTDATNPTHLTTSKQFPLTITGGLEITTPTLPNGIVGAAYSSTVAATGGTTPYSWSASGLPAGLTIDPNTGGITGTPSAAGPATVNLTVNDSANHTANKQLTFTIQPGLSVTTGTLPAATLGAPYSATVEAAGGASPYSWSASGLPAGLTIGATTGVISGTPTASGPATVNVTVADSTTPSHLSATKQFTMSVSAGVALTPQSLTIRGNGNQAFLTLTLSSPAPAGGVEFTLTSTNQSVATVPGFAFLSANSTSVGIRVISVGPGTTTIKANATGYPEATSIVTVAPPGTVSLTGPTTLSLQQTGTLNVSLSAPAPVGGVTITLTTSDPSKVSLVNTTVTIPADATVPAVQPQVKAENVGAASITATASGYTDSAPFVINVGATIEWVTKDVVISGIGKQTLLTLRLTATAPMDGLTVNLTSTSPSVATIQPTAIFIWDGSNAPGSLIPVTSVGSGVTTIKASGTNVPEVTTTVTVVGPLTITSTSLPNAVVGVPYNATVVAAGGKTPYSWSATGLPAGLSIDPSTGVISGTPTSAGPASINVTVLDASSPTRESASHLFTVTIAPGLAITTTSLPGGIATSAYSATIAATGGTPPYTYSATGLPTGLTMNASTGAITGTPAAAWSGMVTVTVTDSTSPTHVSTNKDLSLTIAAAPSITTATLPGGVIDVAYTATLAGTGGTSPYTWAATGLPPGLTLNGTTGAISGTPTAAGTNTVTVTMTDSTGPTKLTASKQFTVVISPPCSWTPSLPQGVAGAPYSYTVVYGCGGTPPYTWSAAGLPSALVINASSGVISGTPASAGSATVDLTVCDSSNPPQCATKRITLVIAPGLSITTTALSDGVINTAYSATVAATGGTPSYTWSATGLPAGLTINAASGVISGTPTVAGATTANVTVSDSTSPTQLSVSRQFTINVATGLSITTQSLPAGVATSVYTTQATAAGGVTPYTWSATGLPANFAIDASNGTISGTPTTTGSYPVKVTVTDSTNPTHQSANKDFTLVIGPALSITTTTLPGGAVSKAYSGSVVAAGGTAPYTWSATGLPAGLGINGSSGAITGTPTTVGSSTVTVTVTDSTGTTRQTVSKELSITISPLLSITTASLPNGVANSSYSKTMAATGGTTPYSWSATGLPAGLTINATTGVISGTPTTAGTSSVDVTVTDAAVPNAQTATARFSVTVAPALTITTASLPAAFAGFAYNFTVSATGGTPSYTWSATGLPAGLTIAPTTGVIAGTAAATGSSSVTVTVTDSSTPTAVSVQKPFTLTVSAGLAITTTALPDGYTNAPYSATVAATGGTPSYSWGASGLPAGLSINASTGAISGSPTATGTSTVRFTVTDSTAGTALTAGKDIQIVVKPGVTITTASPLPQGPAKSPYSVTLAAIGGAPPYTWSATGLPAPLSINATTGVISGTPTAASTGTVNVTVTDSTNPALSASKQFTLAITPELSIVTAALPQGSVTTPYSFELIAAGGTGPYTWAVAQLPAGLTVNPATGVISGTPTAASSANISITATDSTSPTHQTVTKQLMLTITSKLAITTPSLPSNPAGSPYTATVSASGGTTPYSWSATGLPAGFTMNQTTGVITGNPAADAASTSNVTVTVTDVTTPTSQTDSKQFTLVIGPALSITTVSLPEGLVNQSFSATVAAAGGTSPYTWSATGLPTGFAINSSTGVISGTTAAASTNTVEVTATDATNPTHQSVKKQFSLVIRDVLTITTAALPPGITGTPYNFTMAGTGGKGPYTWSSSDLTSVQRLDIAAATGSITGTPLNAGSFTVHITLTDSSTPAVSVTKAFNIAITAVLNLDTTSLPNGTAGYPYSFTPSASGGVAPYAWSAQGLQAAGLSINASTGAITGTPTGGSYPVTLTVTDSTSPARQSASRTLTLVVDVVTPNLITVSDANVGMNLQTPITITLSPPPVTNVTLTITSDNPFVTLGSADTAGSTQLTATVTANTSTVSTYAKSSSSSGTAKITATIVGYTNGVGTVTMSPSGFVLAGPQGIGAAFTTYQGSSPDLTVYAARLNSSGGFVESQQIKGAYSISVGLSASPSGYGTISPTPLAFTGGVSTMASKFTAGTSSTGVTTLCVASPYPFTTPASGGCVVVTIQASGILPCDASLAVGRNLQTNTCLQLTSTALTAPVPVTITSNNPAKLKFSTSPTGTATDSIVVTVPKNQRFTPDFYVHAYDSVGPVTYTATAPGYGSANPSVTLSASGFLINTPYGPDADFSVSLGSMNPTLGISTARLNTSGGIAATQSVASGVSVSIAVTSSTPSVGTIQTSPVTLNAGDLTAYTQFQALAAGSTTITARSSGWTDGAVLATVEAPKPILPTATVGQYLQESGYVILPVPAPAGGLRLTLQSNSGLLKFSNDPAAAGTGALNVDFAEGANIAVIYMQSLGSSGTVTYSASAPGYMTTTGSVDLAPSGIVITGPGLCSACTFSLVAGQQVLTVYTALLEPGTNRPLAPQALAGGSPLSVNLNNSNRAAGDIPGSAVVTPNASSATVLFTPAAVSSTTVSVTQPSGWTTPNSMTQLLISVTP